MKLSRGLKSEFLKLITLQAIWAALSVGLVLWWGALILSQQKQVYELESSLFGSAAEFQNKLNQTQNMIFWEGTVFLALIALSFSLSLYFFFKDKKRSKNIQIFFASITHELKTPLSSIRLQAESIEDQIPNSPLVKRLIDDTHRLETQLERSLELARLEGGGLLHLQELDLVTIMRKVIDQLGAFGNDRVQVSIDDTDYPNVLGDQSAVMIIFKNLIENSAKHSGKKPVQIEFKKLTSSGDQVLISICDSGAGVQGDSSRVGELFYKGHRSQGAGVGLYLVSSLMEKMKGKAEFQSSEDGFKTILTFHLGVSGHE